MNVYDGLLKAVGTEPDIHVYIKLHGDPSVGIAHSYYEIKIPNAFSVASDDAECFEWVESARKKIDELYSELDGECKCTVDFDWEIRAMIELEKLIDRATDTVDEDAHHPDE